jgi:hypothetical protein
MTGHDYGAEPRILRSRWKAGAARAVIGAMACALAACGGGGSGSPAASPSPTPTPSSTPTPPSFPRYDELTSETDLRASTLTFVDSTLVTALLEPVASSTVRVDPIADTLTLLFAGRSVTVGPGDLTSSDEESDIYEIVEGSVRTTVTTLRPEVDGQRVDYLRLFNVSETETGTNRPIGDLVNLLGGLETDDADVVAQGDGEYTGLLRGIGRLDSIPSIADEDSDPFNLAAVTIDAANRTVSVTFDFEGRALSDSSQVRDGGSFRGEATLSDDGSSFEGVLERLDVGGEANVGTFAGAFYGPEADEVAIQYEIDAITRPRVFFAGQIYGRRD